MGVCSSSPAPSDDPRQQPIQPEKGSLADNKATSNRIVQKVDANGRPTVVKFGDVEVMMSEKVRAQGTRMSVNAAIGVGEAFHSARLAQSLQCELGDADEEEQESSDDEVVVNPRNQRNLSLPLYEDEKEELAIKQYAAMRGKRNSIVEYIESVRRVQEHQMDFITKKRTGTLLDPKKNIKFLPRGGTYVHTDGAGPVQFGLPPETIKDCMQLGLTLPTHYVLPKERFNLQTGINVAEFEFPAYFNFFVLRKRINLITTPEVEPLIRTIFRETLLGPEKIEPPTTYSDAVPKECYPDLARESAYFRKNPFKPDTELTIDTLLQFTHFQEGIATLDGGVEIHDEGENYVVYDSNGQETATVSCMVILSAPPIRARTKKITEVVDAPSADDNDDGAADMLKPGYQYTSVADDEEDRMFVPPTFGITMLGNSHGFDPAGVTTGFVLWMNRRGIMVDPPPHSGAILKQDGIPARLIQGMILTHCHADHDAGTFQKILEEGRVKLFTTSTIRDSFLRKYSAISGLDTEFLQKLFEFRDVKIGERISVHGGQLQFFYSLHTIPCVGFAAYCNGKSMVYSADSFNDPAGIEKMFEQGVLSEGRRDKLVNFPWHHSVILHEAGVPPIHTPIQTLVSLPDSVKERLYVVHVSAKDIPADSGLKTADVGPENTIMISTERTADFRAQEILDLVTHIDLFEDFPITRATEILQCARYVTYPKGHVLIEQDTFGDKLYVLAMGIVSVHVNGHLVKKLTAGDHFGEMSIVTKEPRTATITTLTPCELLEFSGYEFIHMTRETMAVQRLRHLGLMQKEESWQCISSNTIFQNLSSAQKTYLQSILNKVECRRSDVIWAKKEEAKIAILIESGLFVFGRAKTAAPFRRGAFVADMPSLLYSKPMSTTLICAKAGSFYYITKRNLLKFFDDNPGVLIYFKDRRFVE